MSVPGPQPFMLAVSAGELSTQKQTIDVYGTFEHDHFRKNHRCWSPQMQIDDIVIHRTSLATKIEG